MNRKANLRSLIGRFVTATQTAGGCTNDLIGFVIWWDQDRAYVLVGYSYAYYCIPSIPATCTNGGKCFLVMLESSRPEGVTLSKSPSRPHRGSMIPEQTTDGFCDANV